MYQIIFGLVYLLRVGLRNPGNREFKKKIKKNVISRPRKSWK